jgi:broad specificity phosphatase PhoE
MSSSQIVPKYLNQAKVLLVRHAKSHFNNDWPTPTTAINTILGTQRYGPQHYKFASNPKYIDCSLCDEGVQQCEEAAVMLKDVRDLTTVFVSPMRRTLETAHLLFRGHADLRNI